MLNHHRVSLCARLLFLVALVCCCCCSSSSVVSATPTATASIVAPLKVDLNEATGSAKVQLSLSKKPLISVSLQLQSPCLRISACSVLFTPLNWNVPKTVTVFIDSTFNTTCCPLQIKAVGDLAFLNKQAKVDVCKLKVAASVGGSYGDPHVYTLDGVAVNALARGDFYLLREFTGEFAVQVRQSQCGGASCNTAIAMKYRGCVVYVYTSETGSPTISIYGSSADAGVVVAENNDVVTFIAPNQAQITVVLRKYGGKYYLYVTFKAPASLGGQVAGLCGFFDGNKANDLRLPDGTIASSDLDFNLGWAVPTAQNLFLDASATIPPIFGASAPGTGPRFGRICRATILPIPGDLSFLDGLLDFSPLKDLLVPPSNPNPPNCDSLVAGLTSATHPAKLACNAVFNTAAAVWCKNKGVKVDAFLKACLCDFVIMGGASFAVDSQQAYLDRCEAEVTARGMVYPY